MTSVRLFLIILLTVTFVAGGIGKAAQRLPVLLGFDVDPTVVAGDWSQDETKTVERNLSVFLKRQLSDSFPYWFFRVDNQSHQSYRRRLDFRLTPWQGDSVMLRVVPWVDDHRENPVAELLWMKLGERGVQGFPPPDTAVQSLSEFIQNVFLETADNSGKIGQWLRRNVPIGPEGAWVGPASDGSLMIALALPMDEFGDLQKSVFKISGRRPGAGTEELEAVGMEYSTPFPPGAETPDMLGIGALAQTYIVGTMRSEISSPLIGRVRQLQLGPVYLLEKRASTAFDSGGWEDEVEGE